MIFEKFQAALIGGLIPLLLDDNLQNSLPWQKGSLKMIDYLIIAPQTIDDQFWRDHSVFMREFSHQPAQLGLMLLPLLVYFHDDLRTLGQHIDRLVKDYNLVTVTQESLYLMAEAIAAGLRRQLNPNTLLSQLKQNHPSFSLWSDFDLIQESLTEGLPLNQVKSKLSKNKHPELTAIALAFFCFCDTPTLPHLSLLRAKQTPLSLVIVGLTGALLGANGSFIHLPKLWQLKIYQNKEIVQKINILWQKWSGNISPALDESWLSSVATPLVMQPRPSLRLISHQEYWDFPIIN